MTRKGVFHEGEEEGKVFASFRNSGEVFGRDRSELMGVSGAGISRGHSFSVQLLLVHPPVRMVASGR